MSEEQPPRPPAYSAHRAQLTFRAEGQPFLKVLPAVCKTVSNIPVSMVAVIGRQARTMSLSLPRGRKPSGMFRGHSRSLLLLIS